MRKTTRLRDLIPDSTGVKIRMSVAVQKNVVIRSDDDLR